MHLLSTLAAFAAAAATAQAAKAFIHNHCSDPVYIWPVDEERDPAQAYKLMPGQPWSEEYYQPKKGGVSIKISRTPSRQFVTQLEYKVAGGTLFYDGSNIDCQGSNCPFNGQNMFLLTSSPSCPQRVCSKNDAICTGFYNLPDDVCTLACGATADTILHLCMPDSQLPGYTGPAVASAPAAEVKVAVSSAAPVVTPTPVAVSSAAPAVVTSIISVVPEQINEAVQPLTTLVTKVIKPSLVPRAAHVHGHRLVHAIKA